MTTLLVFSHCDDEVIFGWPFLQDKSIPKKLLICSSDANNPEREWCKHRKIPCQYIADQLGIECRILDYDSGFYKSNSRDGTLARTIQYIQDNILEMNCDAIFTHNPLGEYGHLDHILTHNICMQMNLPVYYTDAFVGLNWTPYKNISPNYKKIYYNNKVGDYENDLTLYAYWESIYRSHGVWTWCKEPVKRCGVYRV